MNFFRRGFTVAAVAPAGAVKRELVAAGCRALESLGARVKVMPHAVCGKAELSCLAAPDADRAADLTQAWLDPEIDLIWCIRGGYGCARILPLLDWNALRRRPEMAVAGFSDVTALHFAMSVQQCGIPLVLPMFRFLADGLDEFTAVSMKELFAADFRGGRDWKLPALRGECASGFPLPANLCVAAGLAGTPYLPDTAERVILLEEIGEAPYRIDRMLTQLRYAGFFKRCAGVVFGQFTDCGENGEIGAVLTDFAQRVDCPIFTGLPFGHRQPLAAVSALQRWHVVADGTTE